VRCLFGCGIVHVQCTCHFVCLCLLEPH
jgi:hypothetical protein